jgi:septum formation inhibitor MinC
VPVAARRPQALSELGVIAVGVCNASPDVRAVALTAGLPHMMLSHAKSIATAVSSGSGASPTTAGESLNEHVTATSAAATAAAVSYGQRQAAQQQHTAAAQPVTNSTSSSNSSSNTSSSNSSSSASSTAQQQQQQQHRSSAATATAASDAAADDGSSSSGDAPTGDAVEAMVYTGTVRSGQQVYAQGRSLIVVGSVSRLGEVLADGGQYLSE